MYISRNKYIMLRLSTPTFLGGHGAHAQLHTCGGGACEASTAQGGLYTWHAHAETGASTRLLVLQALNASPVATDGTARLGTSGEGGGRGFHLTTRPTYVDQHLSLKSGRKPREHRTSRSPTTLDATASIANTHATAHGANKAGKKVSRPSALPWILPRRRQAAYLLPARLPEAVSID